MAGSALVASPNGAAPSQGGASQPANGDKAPVIPPNPFTRAARQHVEPFEDFSVLMTANQVRRGPIDVPAYGFARHLLLLVTLTGGAGGAAVAHEDSPWRVLETVSLLDVNGQPIVGPFSGFDLFLANKWGAYGFDTNPANAPVHAATDANGNGAFILRIPLEIVERDGLGALPNTDSSATYKLAYTINSNANIFTTIPAGAQPTVRVRAFLEAWSQPPAMDQRGIPNMQAPPAMGTTQFWSKSQFNVNPGEQRFRLTRVGNYIRNIIMVLRSAVPARSTANFPDPFRVELDSQILLNMGRDIKQFYMRERSGLVPDVGVFTFDFTHELVGKMGFEQRDSYLPTTTATKLEIVGNFGAAGVLDVLTNDVVTAASPELYVWGD